jgi:hypothetical protein
MKRVFFLLITCAFLVSCSSSGGGHSSFVIKCFKSGTEQDLFEVVKELELILFTDYSNVDSEAYLELAELIADREVNSITFDELTSFEKSKGIELSEYYYKYQECLSDFIIKHKVDYTDVQFLHERFMGDLEPTLFNYAEVSGMLKHTNKNFDFKETVIRAPFVLSLACGIVYTQ